MNEAYEISRYHPEHKAQVAELQKELWSSDANLNASYLEWKYEQNPYLDVIPIYLAWFRGELVAMRGFYGSAWEAGLPRQEFFLYCADDLVISAAHRNRGLFTRIMKVAFEDLVAGGDGFALTLSGGPMTVLGSLTMGWKVVGPMHQVRRESSTSVWARRVRSARDAMPFFQKLSKWLPTRRERDSFAHLDANARDASDTTGSVCLAREARPEAMARLVEDLGADGRIRHVRDARFFDWRFRNPFHEYRFIYRGKSSPHRIFGAAERSLRRVRSHRRLHLRLGGQRYPPQGGATPGGNQVGQFQPPPRMDRNVARRDLPNPPQGRIRGLWYVAARHAVCAGETASHQQIGTGLDDRWTAAARPVELGDANALLHVRIVA